MRKNIIAKYSAILLASMLIIGCQTAERESEKVGKIVQPGDGTPNDGGNFINDDINSSDGGSVANDDDNATTGTIQIDAKNAYKISVKFSDEYNQKGYYSREEIGKISFDLTNIYTNEPANTSIIDNITLEVEEQNSPTDGKYLNFITYSGEQGPKYSIPKESVKASDSVAIKMKDLSGTTNIILTASIILKDGEAASEYKLKVPIVIEKNKSSSMAIVPIGSRYENGLFIDKFVIHVVDSYGNKAKDGTSISTGVINNPKLYSNAYNGAIKQTPVVDANGSILSFTQTPVDDLTMPTNDNGRIIGYDYGKQVAYLPSTYLDENNNTVTRFTAYPQYYPNIFGTSIKNDRANLNKSDGTFTLSPTDATDVMNNNITELDTLIILANQDQHKPTNLGGYDIKSIDSPTSLSLVSLDVDSDLSGVSYVIGDEYRYIEYGHSIINAAVSAFETTDVKDGLAYAELRYVPEMVGKNVFIYANTRLENKHLGISRKILLQGTGLQSQSLSCTNTEGKRPDCSFAFQIIQNDSGKGAHRVNIAQPQIAGPAVYRYATATQTSDRGWTTISIYGIDENKTATVKFGSLIYDEYILNQK